MLDLMLAEDGGQKFPSDNAETQRGYQPQPNSRFQTIDFRLKCSARRALVLSGVGIRAGFCPRAAGTAAILNAGGTPAVHCADEPSAPLLLLIYPKT